MEFVAGFVTAVILLLSPWTRGGGFHIDCVGRAPGTLVRIKGINDAFENKAQVNLLIVHGMGAGIETDYTPFTESLARHLGLFHVRSADEYVPDNPEGTAPARLFIRTYASADSERTLHVYELHWWYLIQNSKSRLLADERYYPGRRAPFNRRLKANLVNDRIADPIIYLGPLKEHIQESVRHTLRRIACGQQAEYGCKPDDLGRPTIIVTESLGSEIAFSVLRRESTLGTDLARVLSENTPQVFMLANQLPLLGLASEKGQEDPLEKFAGMAQVEDVPERQIVAVSDPSDLLSYPIPKSITQDGTNWINVLRPFGRRLIVGQAVDPLGAHTRAQGDKRVIKMIACGVPSSCSPHVDGRMPRCE